MTSRVLLIAHGATAATRAASFSRDDEPLEPASLAAAGDLGATLLMRHPRTTLLSGPELRCQQTAGALNLSPELKIHPGLADWDLGRWTGQVLDDLATTEPDDVQTWLQDPDAAPHGGESLTQLLRRAGAWLDARPGRSWTVAVAHPAVLRAAAVHTLSAGAAAFWRIDVPPLATLALGGQAGRWSIRLA